MVDCPNCKSVMDAKAGRVPLNHPFSKRKKTLYGKSKYGQYFYCKDCNKSFIVTQALKEVTIP